MTRKIKNSTAGIILSFSLLILSACDDTSTQQSTPVAESSGISNGGGTPTATPFPTPKPTATPKPSATPSPTPVSTGGTGGLKVVFREANGVSSKTSALLEEARVLMEKVLNSEEFKQRVLHFTYGGQETYVQNDGYTNQQIYDLIMAGAEQYPKKTAANQTMDLWVELYNGGSGVIGYTDPSTSTIYMNSYYYSYYTAAEVAGNLTHEWLHKIGFDHDYDSTARRPYSVPYAIGYIAEELAGKY